MSTSDVFAKKIIYIWKRYLVIFSSNTKTNLSIKIFIMYHYVDEQRKFVFARHLIDANVVNLDCYALVLVMEMKN